jgi:hypothetical protein
MAKMDLDNTMASNKMTQVMLMIDLNTMIKTENLEEDHLVLEEVIPEEETRITEVQRDISHRIVMVLINMTKIEEVVVQVVLIDIDIEKIQGIEREEDQEVDSVNI